MKYTFFTTCILGSFGIMISYFVYGPISIPMIIVMVVSCFLLCTKFYIFYKKEYPIYLFIIYIFLISYYHTESFRISTLLYSVAFLFTFILYTRLVEEQYLKLEYYLKLIKLFIGAYVIVLMLQQICVFINVPILNVSHYWGVAPYKLNSLAIEPSHASIIMAILLFSFIRIREIELKRKYSIEDIKNADKWIWFACCYLFLTNGSVLAYIAFAIILIYFIQFRNFIWIFSLFIIATFVIYYFSNDYFVFKRLTSLSEAFVTFDAMTIIKTDASAAARIIPWFWYFQDLNIFSIEAWIGHGTDYSGKLYSLYYLGTAKRVSGFVGGFFPGYIQDMGLIALFLFIPILKTYCLNRWWSMELLIWIILINHCPINSYLFWFGMMMFFTNKYFFNQQNLITDENSIYTCASDKSSN